MLTWFSFLADAGWACLAFDVQGHGRDDTGAEANLLIFAEDLVAVANFVARDPDLSPLPRFVLGHSMGGAAALLALSWGLGAQAGIISSAFARTSTLLHHVLRRWLLPPRLFAPLVRGVWRVRVGRNLEALEPRRTIGRIGVPLLLIHGTRDAVIPDREIERLEAEAPPGTEVLLVEGGGHSDLTEFPAYRDGVLAFLRAAMQK
jgi:pimeloyl-ACP methyl ester carboxylesterase